MPDTQRENIFFVANANDNSVSVISLEQKRVVEILNSAVYPNSPSGSTTNSVALSDDEKTLYIANADNNCLAVFDVSTPRKSFSKGFIPTAWYPTCVRVVKNTIFVANGKGLTSKANPLGPSPKKEDVEHHADLNKKAKVQVHWWFVQRHTTGPVKTNRRSSGAFILRQCTTMFHIKRKRKCFRRVKKEIQSHRGLANRRP